MVCQSCMFLLTGAVSFSLFMPIIYCICCVTMKNDYLKLICMEVKEIHTVQYVSLAIAQMPVISLKNT